MLTTVLLGAAGVRCSSSLYTQHCTHCSRSSPSLLASRSKTSSWRSTLASPALPSHSSSSYRHGPSTTRTLRTGCHHTTPQPRATASTWTGRRLARHHATQRGEHSGMDQSNIMTVIEGSFDVSSAGDAKLLPCSHDPFISLVTPDVRNETQTQALLAIHSRRCLQAPIDRTSGTPSLGCRAGRLVVS